MKSPIAFRRLRFRSAAISSTRSGRSASQIFRCDRRGRCVLYLIMVSRRKPLGNRTLRLCMTWVETPSLDLRDGRDNKVRHIFLSTWPSSFGSTQARQYPSSLDINQVAGHPHMDFPFFKATKAFRLKCTFSIEPGNIRTNLRVLSLTSSTYRESTAWCDSRKRPAEDNSLNLAGLCSAP